MPTPLEHVWRVYDEDHRACLRCGIRLFRRKWPGGHTSREWVLMSWVGVPISNLLADNVDRGRWGSCPGTPPNTATVLIEYTGDPDIYPGCERIMHRTTAPDDLASVDASDVGAFRPICGWHCELWELGPVRHHAGWNWCADCFPEEAAAAKQPPRTLPAAPKRLGA